MKTTIVVDTGIILEYLKTGKGVLPDVYEKYSMIIPSVSVTEVLASKTFSDKGLEEEVVSFLHKYFKIEEVSEKVAHKASEIVREHGVNLMTALIAATAIVGNHKLLTEEKKHFGKIAGVEMLEL